MDTSICWYLNGTEEKFASRYQLRCALHASEFLKLTKPLNLEVPHGLRRIPTDSHGAPGVRKGISDISGMGEFSWIHLWDKVVLLEFQVSNILKL